VAFACCLLILLPIQENKISFTEFFFHFAGNSSLVKSGFCLLLVIFITNSGK
jgi:hypothetical protein